MACHYPHRLGTCFSLFNLCSDSGFGELAGGPPGRPIYEHNPHRALPVGADGICVGPTWGQRRTQRLVKIATRPAQNPGGLLPQAMPQRGELKAACRFFSQPKITYEQRLGPHRERTQAACLEPGEYLLIEDTNFLDYIAHGVAEGLSIIGEDGRGLSRHSTLALKVVTHQARILWTTSPATSVKRKSRPWNL